MTRDPREAAASYRRGLLVVDAVFSDAQRRLGDSVPCRRGCSHCCAALFDIHPADALLLGTWLDAQPADVRAEVLARARAVSERVARAARELAEAGDADLAAWMPGEELRTLPTAAVTRLAAALEGERCPVLGDDGACRAHESRPALCRLQGLPWRDIATGAVLPDYCRLDPRQEGNPPQPLDLARLDGWRHETGELIPFLEGLPGAVGHGRSYVAESLLRWAEGPPDPSRKSFDPRQAP